jgi:chlorobactene glucosyltransferase
MFEVGAFKLLVWALWAGAVLWLFAALITLRGLARQKPLKAAPRQASQRGDAPLVSILVPARNEEGRTLDQSIRSMLAQDYERFEVIAVNDCSTDATGTILKAIAKTDERLRVIDGTPTPVDWLGKPHALQQALDRARGEWILATDADMIFHEAAARTALTQAIAEGYDAVTLIPRIESTLFWERALMPAFGWFVVIAFPIERVNDPRRREAIGVGGFFLVNRAALRRVGEYAAVRAEVLEDVRMAELLKQSGARLRIEYAPDLTSTAGYSSLREIWEGFTKNIFAVLNFSLLQTLMGITASLVFIIAPFCVMLASASALAAGLSGGWSRLFLPALIIWLIQVSTFAAVNRAFRTPARFALTVPLGHTLVVAILINSAFRIATGRGVLWKGRKVYERASGVRPPRHQAPDLPFADD